MHVLAPELGLPPALALGFLDERRGEVVYVGSNDVVLNHLVKPIAKIAFEPDLRRSCAPKHARRNRHCQ